MEFTFVFLICPAIVLVASITGYVLTKKWFIVPGLTLLTFTLLTLTVFNASFFIWVVAYTALSTVVSLAMLAARR